MPVGLGRGEGTRARDYADSQTHHARLRWRDKSRTPSAWQGRCHRCTVWVLAGQPRASLNSQKDGSSSFWEGSCRGTQTLSFCSPWKWASHPLALPGLTPPLSAPGLSSPRSGYPGPVCTPRAPGTVHKTHTSSFGTCCRRRQTAAGSYYVGAHFVSLKNALRILEGLGSRLELEFRDWVSTAQYRIYSPIYRTRTAIYK